MYVPAGRSVTEEEKAERIAAIRALAAKGISGRKIAAQLGVSPGAISGLCHRNAISLKAIKRSDARKRQPKPEIKFSNSASLVTHVVSEKMPTAPPKITPRCTWHGCTQNAFAAGKPYCREHHVKGGGLFCA